MTRTVDDAIAEVRVKAHGRTRFEGQEPFADELLVAEIDALRAAVRARETWLRDNADAIAVATVAAFEQAPHGSGMDGGFGCGAEAIAAILDGETDILKAVSRATGPHQMDDNHWSIRWAKRGELPKVKPFDECHKAVIARAREGTDAR